MLSETEDINITSGYTSRDEELIVVQRTLIDEVTTEMNEFKYYLVSEKLYHYVWHTFADEILEESKGIFTNGSPEDVASRKRFLRESLITILKVLHPFMPFITEEIWQEVKSDNERDILMTALWPTL